MKTNGILVALEGIDNVGKTYQVTRLAEYFRNLGQAVFPTKELTSPIGQYIKNSLYSKGLSPLLKTYLFATDRAIRYEQQVLPALQKNMLVLADRWSLSAYVYRGLENFDVAFVMAVNSKIPMPDLTIILDLPVKLSLQRGLDANKPCPYSAALLEEARERYLSHARTMNLTIINGAQTMGSVFEEIKTQIKMYM